MRVLVTGAAGFIGTYITKELKERGHSVRGLDDFSKYGRVSRDYELVEGDCKDLDTVLGALEGCDYLIAGAARIGGIAYFHAFPYDLLAENERITAATCDAAIEARRRGWPLKKAVYISSSMVFENTNAWPSYEGDELEMPPPSSSYGFQKLALEYWARAAWDQYQLPYTIVRPFNCVGTGEAPYMAHVVPDLIRKVLGGQDPLHILGDGYQIRHYTHGSDIARGIVTAMEHPDAMRQSFNIASPEGTTVLELARFIWQRIHGPGKPFRYVTDRPYEHDVLCRIPDVTKASQVLGFKAEVPLRTMVEEVIAEVKKDLEASA